MKLRALITVFIFTFTLSAQELSKSYFEINDLIIVDSKKAKEKIDSLEIVYIKNSDEKALQMRLEYIKKLLCPACRKGLKKFEVKCGRDYRNFIVCEYIIRALNT